MYVSHIAEVRSMKTAGLWAEFLFLYVVVPFLVAVILPAHMMFPMLFLMTALGIILLISTAGFRWGRLMDGAARTTGWPVISIAMATFIASYITLAAHAPEALFAIWERPHVMLIIAVFYPLLSALPQELVFRPLFFRRYGALLPKGRAALIINAALFSFAHLMYWNWVVMIMTFAGGLAFAWAYEIRRSFILATVMHSVAGVVLFATGMGIYFYSGNVIRPF